MNLLWAKLRRPPEDKKIPLEASYSILWGIPFHNLLPKENVRCEN
jgi:hypothetical protein